VNLSKVLYFSGIYRLKMELLPLQKQIKILFTSELIQEI